MDIGEPGLGEPSLFEKKWDGNVMGLNDDFDVECAPSSQGLICTS